MGGSFIHTEHLPGPVQARNLPHPALTFPKEGAAAGVLLRRGGNKKGGKEWVATEGLSGQVAFHPDLNGKKESVVGRFGGRAFQAVGMACVGV